MRLALGQTPDTGSVVGNVAAAVALLERAAGEGADLLVLHELQLCGYDLDALAADDRLIVTIDDRRLEPLQSACAEHSTAVMLGAAVREPRGLANAIVYVDAAGRVDLLYRKIHLWHEEAALFHRGERLVVLEIAGIRTGVAICYDAGFPEVARAYARAGVELLIFCSAFAEGDQEHRYRIYHPARALENGMFVAVANAIGEHGGDVMFGRSQLFDPRGRLLRELGDGPALVTYDIAPGRAEHERLRYLHDLHELSTPHERTIA